MDCQSILVEGYLRHKFNYSLQRRLRSEAATSFMVEVNFLDMMINKLSAAQWTILDSDEVLQDQKLGSAHRGHLFC